MSGRCKINKFFGCVILLLSIFSGYSQDIHFSQFFEAPLLRNPSLAGIFNGDLRFQMVYRNQWASVTVPYKTGSFNTEYKMPVGSANDFLTIGGQVVYDKAGSTNFQTVQVLPALNYHKALSGVKNRYLSAGFMAGYVNRSIDPSKVTTNNQYDGSGYNPAISNGEPLVNYSLGYWDGSAGISFNSEFGNSEDINNNFFIGIAYHHFNRPKNSFYKIPDVELNAKWVFSMGVRFTLNDKNYYTVNIDRSSQGAYKETIAGIMGTFALDDNLETAKYNLSFGAFIRWEDALIPVIKLDYKPFSIAFSYDVNMSQLKTSSQGRGGFELSLTHISFFDRNNSTKNAVLCPRF